MEDETLNNILNLLQNANNNSNNANSSTDTTASSSNLNNDIQNLLIKFLLSGGLNQIMNLRNQNQDAKTEPTPPPEKLRTIDLSNYQRLD